MGELPGTPFPLNCSTSLTSTSHCGLCGVQCQSIPHATPGCVAVGSVYVNPVDTTVSAGVLLKYVLNATTNVTGEFSLAEYLDTDVGPLGDGLSVPVHARVGPLGSRKLTGSRPRHLDVRGVSVDRT